MRKSGVLLSVSSLPSKYGIGCFDEAAYKFVDDLVEEMGDAPEGQFIHIGRFSL